MKNLFRKRASQFGNGSESTPSSKARHRKTGSTESKINNATACLAVLKDLGEVLENIPYVKVIAGVTLTLLRIREETKEVDDLSLEVIAVVEKRSSELIQSLKGVPPYRLEGLQASLQEYHSLLNSIATCIQESSRSGRIVLRLERREDLQRYLRELKEFDGRFTVKTLTEISVQLDKLVQHSMEQRSPNDIPTELLFQEAIPPRPAIFLGRESELNAATALLLASASPRVAILGSGGLGKTSLLAALLHDSRVSTLYPRRFFVSCDQVVSLPALLNAIACVLHFNVEQRGPALQTNILSFLRHEDQRTLFCLDNFEDTWDPPGSRADIESFLSHLNGITQLGVIITMRGEERPRGLNWTRPALPLLQPLDDQPAIALYEEVYGQADDRIPKLVKQVDNVPLAIQLLARQAELDGMDDVLCRWTLEGLGLLDHKDASDTRNTSVTASIEISLRSPRISQIPHILDVLRILALLLDGLSASMVDALQKHLPPSVNLRRCLQALKHAALCYCDQLKRYRLLAPIRQYIISSITLDVIYLEALKKTFYNHIIGTDVPDYDLVVPELPNIRLFITLDGHTWDAVRIEACLAFLWWEDHALSIRDIPLALQTLPHANTPELEVRCRLKISDLYRYSSQQTKAEQYLRPALDVKTGDPFWDGMVQKEMGEFSFFLDRFEDSERFLRLAASLFQEAGNPTWEAVALEKLGRMLRWWGRFDDAEVCLTRCLALAKEVNSVIEVGNALGELGDVYARQGRMDKAEEALLEATTCAQTSHSPVNEAIALRRLGDVYYDAGKWKDAERTFLHVRDISLQINDPRLEADSLQGVGRVHHEMEGKFESAEKYLHDSLMIFRRLRVDNIAYTSRSAIAAPKSGKAQTSN